MISRQRFNRERLLSGTLVETLILFLFIFLAIASIYEKNNRELTRALRESNLLGPNQIPVDSLELVSLIAKVDNYVELYNELEKAKEDFKENAEEIERYKDLVDSKGVMPPPCVLANDNQTLFEVDYGANWTFLIKVTNLENTLRLSEKWVFRNNEKRIFTRKEFDEIGFLLHESRRIDPNDDNCDRNVEKAWSSANCYDCVYVVNIADHSKDQDFFQSFSNFQLDKEVVKKMQRKLQDYFMIR